MGTTIVPEKTIVTCDSCGKECGKDDRRRDSSVTFKQLALDDNGCAWADASASLELCDTCSPMVRDAINNRVNEIRSGHSLEILAACKANGCTPSDLHVCGACDGTGYTA